MKVYVTKYSLGSNGKIAVANVDKTNNDDKYFMINGWGFMTLGKDAYETPEAAVSAAKAARDKRIASLRKQIANLEAMTFRVVEGDE
jgi:hypothetical protein